MFPVTSEMMVHLRPSRVFNTSDFSFSFFITVFFEQCTQDLLGPPLYPGHAGEIVSPDKLEEVAGERDGLGFSA